MDFKLWHMHAIPLGRVEGAAALGLEILN